MNTELPSYEQIVALHKKYAPSAAAYDLIFTHCEIVWEIAQQLMKQSNPAVDAEFIKAACLLHDIGAYGLFLPQGGIDHANYIRHGILGDELLGQEGFSEPLCRIASHHTGVGLRAGEIKNNNLPLPIQDFMAETIEERLVMYADKFHTKTTPPRLMRVETYRVFTGKFDLANVQRFMQFEREFGVPNLAPLAKKYNIEIV